MDYYAGIDVSLEQSSVCVVDGSGKIARETKVAREPEALSGPVAVWCRSFDGIMCSKGDEPWAQARRMSFARMRCELH